MGSLYNCISKNSLFFKSLSFFILFCFVFSLSGCVTTETAAVRETSDQLREDFEILSIMLKNGTEIPVKDLNPKFIKNDSGRYSSVIYYARDTVNVSYGEKKISYTEKKYDFKDISSVKVNILEYHTQTVVIVILTPLALFGLYALGWLIGLGSMH